MRRSEVLDRLPIAPSDFVVEVGAGPVPYRHTKLILDKYPFENLERHGDIVNSAPVIKADAARLPLRDRSCDALFASHVIEHLPDPGAFLEETKRCARSVYLEFPTPARELMYAWSFHRWLVEVEGTRLTFYRNDVPQLFSDFFHTGHDFLLDQWSQERFEELNACVFANTDDLDWRIAERTALEHLLARSATGSAKVNFESEYGRSGTTRTRYPLATRLRTMLWAATPEFAIRLRNRLRGAANRARRVPLGTDVVSRLLCPGCRRGSLGIERNGPSEELACGDCGERYVSTDGVFDLDR